MKSKSKSAMYLVAGVVFMILVSGFSYAQEHVKGASDHPAISRFSGTSIVRYDVKELDEYTLPLGKMEKGQLARSQKLEGKVFQITYAAPQSTSILEIYRSYESHMMEGACLSYCKT